MTWHAPVDVLQDYNNGKQLDHFAWPGGYQMFYYVHADNEHMHCCPDCTNKNDFENVNRVEAFINWEDTVLTCDVCQKLIPASYGENQPIN